MNFAFYFVCWLSQAGMGCSRRVYRQVITLNFVSKLFGKTATFEKQQEKMDNIKISLVVLSCEDVNCTDEAHKSVMAAASKFPPSW
jgi:hypothetical protein